MDALGINIPGLLTQVISFLFLFLLLRAVLYRPLLRMMDERSAKIKESLETAEQTRQEAQLSREEMKKQIDEARAEGQAMIDRAREVADRFREDELAKAREEINKEKAKAEANIQLERDSAIEELRRQFAGMAIAAAEKVVERSLDGDTHQELIESVLAKGFGEDSGD